MTTPEKLKKTRFHLYLLLLAVQVKMKRKRKMRAGTAITGAAAEATREKKERQMNGALLEEGMGTRVAAAAAEEKIKRRKKAATVTDGAERAERAVERDTTRRGTDHVIEVEERVMEAVVRGNGDELV